MAFWRAYYQLVWTTKYRAPIITAVLEARLYAYMVARAAEEEVVVHAINGWYDHIHILAAIPPKHAVADIVGHIKGASSHFVNHTLQLDLSFAWQRGYGVFTLGERQRPFAEAYINNQKQHHQAQTMVIWLEYTADDDEGPQQPTTKNDQSLHETQETYHAFGDLPF